MWEGIAEHLMLAEPIAVPMADGNLMEAVVGLQSAEILGDRQYLLGIAEILHVIGGEIVFYLELGALSNTTPVKFAIFIFLRISSETNKVGNISHQFS